MRVTFPQQLATQFCQNGPIRAHLSLAGDFKMAAVENNEKKLSDNENIELLKDNKTLPLLCNQNEKSPKKTDKTNAAKDLAEKHGLRWLPRVIVKHPPYRARVRNGIPL